MKTLLSCVVALSLCAAVCRAQDQRSRFGFGGRGSSPQDMQSRLQRYDAFLKQFDVNGDGTIQPNEIPAERKSLFENMARRVGLDPNTPITIAQFRDASMQRYMQRASSRSGYSRGGAPGGPGGMPPGGPGGMPGAPPGSGFPGGGPPGGAPPGGTGGSPAGTAPPGFGAPPGAAAPGTPGNGFGPPMGTGPPGQSPYTPGAAPGTMVPGAPVYVTVTPGVVPPTSTPAAAPQTTVETQLKSQYHARTLLRKLDANQNGSLDKEEWTKQRPDLKAADRNGDTTITVDELTAWVLDSAQKGVAGMSPTRFYRALTPTERLPDGLPEWFARKDADGDGQVAMAEYSHVWNEETVAEFARYDLNGDGFITPAECLEALKPRQP